MCTSFCCSFFILFHLDYINWKWIESADSHWPPRHTQVSYPSLPLLWIASSSVMPSSDLKASQSIFDFSSVLIFCFFPPIRPRMLDMPAGRLALQKQRGWEQRWPTGWHHYVHTGQLHRPNSWASVCPAMVMPRLKQWRHKEQPVLFVVLISTRVRRSHIQKAGSRNCQRVTMTSHVYGCS